MSPQAEQHTYPYNCPTGRWTMLATVLASSMAFIDSTALNVILPSLQRDLDASGIDLFWVLNTYLLMLAALIIVGGSLGDKLGRVKVFKIGITIFIIGSIACGLSPTILILQISRTLQGIGGALMIPGSLAIISSVFDPSVKGKAIGTWSAATTIVTICGPVLGGALADMGLWRLIFYINVPIGIFSLWILQFKVPESKNLDQGKVDWLGAITLIVSLGAITLAFLEMPELGTQHLVVRTSFILGILFFLAFIGIEVKSKSPMMDLSLFRKLTFSGVNAMTFILYAALGGMMLFLSLNIIQIQGYSQLQAGLTFLPFSLTMVVIGRKMGQLTDKYGARRFLIIGPLLTAAGMYWFSVIGETNGPSDYWTTFFPGMMLFSIGMSVTVVPLTTTVMGCVESKFSGIASGINNSVSRISGTFINAIFGAIAVFAFSNIVTGNLSHIQDIDFDTQRVVIEETVKLGEAKAPMTLVPEMQNEINQVLKLAFIEVYQYLARICAVLALLSAFVSVFTVRDAPKLSEEE